jgi:hypothetical protein
VVHAEQDEVSCRGRVKLRPAASVRRF